MSIVELWKLLVVLGRSEQVRCFADLPNLCRGVLSLYMFLSGAYYSYRDVTAIHRFEQEEDRNLEAHLMSILPAARVK